MDPHSRFSLLLLSCTTVFTVLQGQTVVTDHEVTGYQSHDVTLPCHYRSTEEKLTQVEWTWKKHSSKKNESIIIIIFSTLDVPFVHNTFLKDRVSFKINSNLTTDASLIIKDVKMTDQGVYTCNFATYPGGSQTGETTLKVIEGKPPDLSTAVTAGIVTVLLLIIMILASVGCLFLIKRRRAASTSAYYITQSPGDPQQGDVTYADVMILKPDKVNRNTLLTGDIEYAAISFNGQTRMTSQQGSANHLAFSAHSSEHGSVYAEIIKD